jgi:hypothetical protein
MARSDRSASSGSRRRWRSAACRGSSTPASTTPARPIFISDNNGFDWGFVNYYFHRFLGKNPFGHSSQNLGSLYKGVVKDTFANFKHLRVTRHTHHPVDDARGNAEALLRIQNEHGLKIALD